MNRSRRLVLVLFTIVIAIAATTLSAARIEEEFNRTVPLEPGQSVLVDNENGSVTIESWNRNEVRIEATRYVDAGSRDSAREALSKVQVEVSTTGSGVEIRTVMPRSSDGFFSWLMGSHSNAGVTYRITVPRSVDLDIDTVNGRVSVSGVAGRMNLESTNGRIEVRKASGHVNASTTNGRIFAELVSVDRGGMRFSTTNGSVTLELPDNLEADVNASTTNGSIKTEFPITVQGSFGKNRLEGSINGGGETLRIRTTNGSIRINRADG